MKTETENLRELNCWIAEHVMGWKRVIDKDHPRCSYWDIGVPQANQDIWFCDEYTPTTDPSAAMQVLERCISKADQLEFDKFPNGDFRCFDWSNSARAETLPLAIAKFAKALYSK